MVMKEKQVYIHFESKPEVPSLAKYFERYPAYRKVFALSYCFSVPSTISRLELREWAEECLPYHAYVLSIGSHYHHVERGLISFNSAITDEPL